VLGRPRRCKLAHAFPGGYSDKRRKLAQLLGQPGVFLTASRQRVSAGGRAGPGDRRHLGGALVFSLVPQCAEDRRVDKRSHHAVPQGPGVHLGFGRIVASEMEAPNMLVFFGVFEYIG
jgi:hypothetical protein